MLGDLDSLNKKIDEEIRKKDPNYVKTTILFRIDNFQVQVDQQVQEEMVQDSEKEMVQEMETVPEMETETEMETGMEMAMDQEIRTKVSSSKE